MSVKHYYVTDANDERIEGPFYDMYEAYKAVEAVEEMSPDEEFYLEVVRD